MLFTGCTPPSPGRGHPRGRGTGRGRRGRRTLSLCASRPSGCPGSCRQASASRGRPPSPILSLSGHPQHIASQISCLDPIRAAPKPHARKTSTSHKLPAVPGLGGPSAQTSACRPQAAPLTLTLCLPLHPPPARTYRTLAVPLPGYVIPAPRGTAGMREQEHTPHLLTSLLPKLPSCPAPAVATPGPLGPHQTPLHPCRHLPPGAFCGPMAHPRARP